MVAAKYYSADAKIVNVLILPIYWLRSPVNIVPIMATIVTTIIIAATSFLFILTYFSKKVGIKPIEV